MKINHINSTIELTKAFERKARTFGSPEYNALVSARKDFASYKVIVNESKNSSFRGMDCEFMANYVKGHDDENGTIIAEFDKLRSEKTPYGAIRKWFVEKYPKFGGFTTKSQWVLAD